MTSQQQPDLPLRVRKISCTYSLTKRADGSYNLITSSLPPRKNPHPISTIPVDTTTPTQINLSPHSGPNRSRIVSRYQPYIPRGPPANLYLHRQTVRQAAASDKSLAQIIAAHEEYYQRIGAEQRTIERGEPPRKSARVQAKTGIVNAGIADQLDVEEEDIRPKKKARTTRKEAQILSMQDPPAGTATSASSPPPPTAKRPRKKPEPKVNPRPTERLVTRGLAKSSFASQSRSGSGDDTEAVEKAPVATAEELTGQKRKRKDTTIIVKETVSSASTTPEGCPSPLPAAFRGQSSSSDTLVDVPTAAFLAIKKELIAEETASIVKDLSEELPTSTSTLPSNKAILSSGNHPSGDGFLTSTELISLTAPSHIIPRDQSPSKRSHSEVDEEQQDPAPRRSTRAVKRRKLE